MATRRRKNRGRLYARSRDGGEVRYYADLRSFGKNYQALVAPGETMATTDPDVAAVLLADVLKVAEAEKSGVTLPKQKPPASLAWLAAKHLEAKAAHGEITTHWLEEHERMLNGAIAFFEANGPRPVESITPTDVRRWIEHLQSQSNRRGGKLSGGSVRHSLNVLSNLYRFAIQEGYATLNPVRALMYKPKANRREAKWLEVSDCAVLLERARVCKPVREHGIKYALPLIATFLLTGGRCREVLGLEVSDISLERRLVTFRENDWRRLKTTGSTRSVPLWPQLENILRAYLDGPDAPTGSLLFPSRDREGREAMIDDVRKLLDKVAVVWTTSSVAAAKPQPVDWKPGEIRTKMFRHSYCAARLQTLDHGAPVGVYTVARELGHGSLAMVTKVYGHLGEVRHRSEVVEYRVEQHEAARRKLALIA
jgi:integrase